MDRLLVDVGVDGRVVVSTWFEGEAPEAAGGAVELVWPVPVGELEELRWYLEDYLRAPFGVYEHRGPAVAERLTEWGQAVFSAVFGAGAARDAYVAFRERAKEPGSGEIVVRSAAPGWLGLPWELLCAPGGSTPVVLSGVGVSRRLPTAPANRFDVAGERLRVLMVISRPQGERDVGYRMIARPLLDRLDAVRGQVDLVVLRPPTLEALGATLRAAREAGNPFQVVHFDGHGALTGGRSRFGPAVSFAESAGVLDFEKPGGGSDPVPAEKIAQVLAEAQVPVVVLNACQSGAVGKELEAAVATRLLAGGASAVVAMAYSVYAVAAAEFMTAFYERLFAGDTVAEAVRAGRARMAQRPERPSPKGELPLADWIIPVHYARREVHFPHLRTDPAARGTLSLTAALDQLRDRDTGDNAGDLAADGTFVGRDGLFYTLEVAARTQHVIVLHGPAGTGKTELAKAFGRWWRDTGGIDHPDLVFWHSFKPGLASFGLDGVLSEIGQRVFGPEFALQDRPTRIELVHQVLADNRLLLIWDNVESAVTMPDPTAATPPLDEAGQAELKAFLTRIAAGSRSAVILTSRTPEPWLGNLRRIPVGGLTPSEAIEYTDHLLAPFPAAAPRRTHRVFAELLEWLDGHPLSMRLLLPHLDTTDPATLLAALHGTVPLPGTDTNDRSTSLPASLTYSITHLDPTTRRLLTALCLFHGVADSDVLGLFSAHNHVPTRFAGTKVADWVAVLDRAAHVGLLTPLGSGMYAIHPALPAYLSAQWHADDPADYSQHRAAAQRALLDAYATLGRWLLEQIQTGDAALAFWVIQQQRRTLGHLLGYALDHALWDQAQAIAEPLNHYWDATGLTEEAGGWVDRARIALEGPDGTPPALDQPAGLLWVLLVGWQANRQHQAGQLDAAEATHAAIRDMFLDQPESPTQRRHLATAYHQLGMVAQLRGNYDRAEQWYQESLAISEELGNRPALASSYHQLGTLAEDRGDYVGAEQWYQQSLAISEELGNRPGLISSYHQLGTVAHRRGDYDRAEQWYQESLAISEELGNRLTLASSYHQLGMLAEDRGDYVGAEQWYQQSLAIDEELGNRPGLADSYHQLGRVAQNREDYDGAEQWYQQSLAINEELGDRPGMAMSYMTLGFLADERGRYDDALDWTVRSVAVFDVFPYPATEQGARQLAWMTNQRGVAVVEQSWLRVTGNPLPPEVRAFITQPAEGDDA